MTGLYSHRGLQRIGVERGFVGCLDRSREMSPNARPSKEASRRTVPTVCCRLLMCRGNSAIVRIPKDTESPSMISSDQGTDSCSKALDDTRTNPNRKAIQGWKCLLHAIEGVVWNWTAHLQVQTVSL
ncbi:hypothetical protein AVEN_264565-1 [Araneus ventricosus]|uniref:Uncharacterized protein n=1 Tax=Araneus ventricosus TaxID=182803 RepID=A0A4Y2S5D1_ARAVE|nr:hypothetical protein AVEN_264565-1 [Araneus ventricosus]